VRAALLAGLIIVGAAAPAHGGDATIPVPDQPAQLTVDAAWVSGVPRPVPDGPSIVLHHPGGALLAVTVAIAPNTDAWRLRTRPAYVAEIVEGFEAMAGVTVVDHATTTVGGVPCLDLSLRRTGGDGPRLVAVRLLLFRTRTIALAAEGDRDDAALLGAAVRGLVPTIEVDPAR
jgi:hypothetical protein